MKNTITDLHNLLMEQLERVRDAEGEELKVEISRGKSMSEISEQIISNAKVALEATKVTNEYTFNGEKAKLPQFLEDN